MTEKARPIILMAIELPSRELLAYQVLALELERRGYQPHICAYPDLNREIHRLQPAVVVNNANRRKDHFYPYFYGTRHLDFRIVDMTWEQIMSSGSFRAYQYSDGFEQYYIDLVTAWGNGYRDHLIQQGMPESKVAITGAPKQALIKLAQALVSKDEVIDHLLGPEHLGRKIVTMATSFQYAYLPLKKAEWYRRQGIPVDFRIAWTRLYHDLYCQLLSQLAPAYPDVLFILRPHPSKHPEYAASYQQVIGNLANVVMLPEGDFMWVLLASDAVIATHSSTLFEAFIAGIPTLCLLEFDQPFYDHPLLQASFRFFGRAVTSDELLANLPDMITEGPRPEAPKLAQRFVDYWINIGHGRTFANIADAIEDVMHRDRVPWKQEPLYELYWTWRRWSERRRGRLPIAIETDDLGKLLLKRLRERQASCDRVIF